MMLPLLAVAACSTPPPPSPSASEPAFAQDDRNLVAILVAGDDSVPVFDDTISYLHDLLVAAGVPEAQIHRLSARPGPGLESAGAASVLARIAAARPGPGGSCLIYLASHGTPDGGIYLARGNGVLEPEALDKALEAGCGQAPTVVVASACYAGGFAGEPMTRPNRIILTASRNDRPSFGCEAGAIFTVYDECLLGALPGAADWPEIARRTEGCVALRERALASEPSEPQSFAGPAAAALGAPWRSGGAADPEGIVFTPGPARYAPALVPFGAFEREHRAGALRSYAVAAPPKAMALTLSGLVVPADARHAGGGTADDIARMALQRCEFLSGGACVLFARDDRMVELLPSGLTPLHPEILVRDGPLRPEIVPFIRADQRPAVERYLLEAGPKALAVSPGHVDLGLGAGPSHAAARQDALARCQADGHRCVIYAEDNRVVLGWGP